jgi:uncharacterized protein
MRQTKRRTRWAGALALGIIGIVLCVVHALAQPAKVVKTVAPENELLEADNIRVVMDISRDEVEGGVGKALSQIQQLLQTYKEAGIGAEAIHIYAIFHDDAAYWVLNDAAYVKAAKKSGANPNKTLVEEIQKAGISVEICTQTMKRKGWKPEDILPGVKVLANWMARLIDLQLNEDAAYVKF